MADAFDTDVVVVGAEPVGLALAIGLTKDGCSSVVLEAKSGLSEHSKAVTIWPRTQEVFDRLGILESFEKASLCETELHMTDADAHPPKRLLTLNLKTLDRETRFPRLLLIPQNETERVLYENLKSFSKTRVEFAASAFAVPPLAEGAVVRYMQNGQEKTLRARVVVGCDGAHSVVRGAIGAHLVGETYPIKAGLADVRLPEERDYEFPRLTTSGGVCFAIRASKDLWRLIFIDRTDTNWDLPAMARSSSRALFEQEPSEIVWTSDFKLHRRAADTFGKGWVVLAGDAAHLNSPVGGQGMNSGIQDTEALRHAIRDALNESSGAPLERYATERKKQVESGVNRFTGTLTSVLIFNSGKELRKILKLAGLAVKIPYLQHQLVKRAAMLTYAQAES